MSNERIQCDGCKRDRACLLAGRCLDAEPLHDDYKPLDHDPDKIERCPVCGSEGKLWQYTTSPTSPRQLVVMCDHGEPIGPQDGIRDEGCLLYMPPESFYQARITDAVRYWNDFAKALIELRATPNRSTTVSDITQDAEKIEDIMALADEYAHRRWSAAVSACHFDKLGEKQADADAAEARAALDAAIRQAMADDADGVKGGQA